MVKPASKPAAKVQQAPPAPAMFPPADPSTDVGAAGLHSIEMCVGPNALSMADMKTLLGWETEAEYAARKQAEEPTLWAAMQKRGESFCFPETPTASINWFADKQETPQKAWLRLSTRNRDERQGDTLKYCQDILQRNWACPMNFPGESLTGEPLMVGRSGELLSGRHRGKAFIFACQLWNRHKDKFKKWETEPVFECSIYFGVSEDHRVVRTIDNTVTRTEADVLQASGWITKPPFEDLAPPAKKEAARMMSKCIDLLWDRTTDPNSAFGQTHLARTNSEAEGFLDRFPRIKRAIRYFWNKDNNSKHDSMVSGLNLNGGHVSACLFLMGCSGTLTEKFAKHSEPTDATLDWGQWDKATEFFDALFPSKDADDMNKEEKQRDKHFGALRIALKAAAGMAVSGRDALRAAVIARAWNRFKDGGAFLPAEPPDAKEVGEETSKVAWDHVQQAYGNKWEDELTMCKQAYRLVVGNKDSLKLDENGTIRFVDSPAIRFADEKEGTGIDLGSGRKVIEPPPLTKEQLEAKKEAERVKREELEKKMLADRQAAEDAKAKAAEPSATVAAPGSGKNGEPGKPPTPKMKGRKAQEAKQTADAKAADEAKQKEADEAAELKATQQEAAKVAKTNGNGGSTSGNGKDAVARVAANQKMIDDALKRAAARK